MCDCSLVLIHHQHKKPARYHKVREKIIYESRILIGENYFILKWVNDFPARSKNGVCL
jgi:hypothetical protein